MFNASAVVCVICLLSVQSVSEDWSINELLIRSTDILEKSMTKEEKIFLSGLPLSCTVQWLQIKKRSVFSGNEYDGLSNDPGFWEHANKKYKIVHAEEYFFSVVCVVYYHRLNEKNWDSAMCMDYAAALVDAPKKASQSKHNIKPRR